MTVAALYVDPHGWYPQIVGRDLCWDKERAECGHFPR